MREVLEETWFALKEYTFHGIIHFRSDKEDEEMYLYSAKAPASLMPISCDEGSLEWIDKDKLLDLPTWEGDKLFLEKLIAGKKSIEMTLVYKGDKLVYFDDKTEQDGGIK